MVERVNLLTKDDKDSAWLTPQNKRYRFLFELKLCFHTWPPTHTVQMTYRDPVLGTLCIGLGEED